MRGGGGRASALQQRRPTGGRKTGSSSAHLGNRNHNPFFSEFSYLLPTPSHAFPRDPTPSQAASHAFPSRTTEAGILAWDSGLGRRGKAWGAIFICGIFWEGVGSEEPDFLLNRSEVTTTHINLQVCTYFSRCACPVPFPEKRWAPWPSRRPGSRRPGSRPRSGPARPLPPCFTNQSRAAALSAHLPPAGWLAVPSPPLTLPSAAVPLWPLT